MKHLSIHQQIAALFSSAPIRKMSDMTGLPTRTVANLGYGKNFRLNEQIVEALKDLGYEMRLVKMEAMK